MLDCVYVYSWFVGYCKNIASREHGFPTKLAKELKPEDFLNIQFVLDDLKRSVIKRQIVLKDIEGDYVRAEFYNPPPYAANLGFYMIN